MSQDQRPQRVRLTSTGGSGSATRRVAPGPAPRATAKPAPAPAVRRRLDWSVVALFAIACLIGGVLTTLLDLPGLLLS
jgi:hypothetical protein